MVPPHRVSSAQTPWPTTSRAMREAASLHCKHGVIWTAVVLASVFALTAAGDRASARSVSGSAPTRASMWGLEVDARLARVLTVGWLEQRRAHGTTTVIVERRRLRPKVLRRVRRQARAAKLGLLVATRISSRAAKCTDASPCVASSAARAVARSKPPSRLDPFGSGAWKGSHAPQAAQRTTRRDRSSAPARKPRALEAGDRDREGRRDARPCGHSGAWRFRLGRSGHVRRRADGRRRRPASSRTPRAAASSSAAASGVGAGVYCSEWFGWECVYAGVAV